MQIRENVLAKNVVDTAFQIHVKLGPGLLESVYEKILAYELEKRGHKVQTQVPIPIMYDGQNISEAFRADMIIDDLIIIELKSIESLSPVHKKQLITYLKLSEKRLGLLLNFGAALMKQGIVRIANGIPEE